MTPSNLCALQGLLDSKQRFDETNHHLFRSGLRGVYALSDPRDLWHVRYVGASQDIQKRWRQHATGATPQFSDGPKREWLSALARQRVQPVLFVLELTRHPRQSLELHAVERRWIQVFRQYGCADLNVQLTRDVRKTASMHTYAREDWKRMFFEQRRENEKLSQELTQLKQHVRNMHVGCSGKPADTRNTTQHGAIARVVCCECGGASMFIDPQYFA